VKHAIVHPFIVTAALSATALAACGSRTEATRSSGGPITAADASDAADGGTPCDGSHSSDAGDGTDLDAGCGISCTTFRDCLAAQSAAEHDTCNASGMCIDIPYPKCIRGQCVLFPTLPNPCGPISGAK